MHYIIVLLPKKKLLIVLFSNFFFNGKYALLFLIWENVKVLWQQKWTEKAFQIHICKVESI